MDLNNLKSLLKDNIIDKESLLLKKYSLIGLTESEMILVNQLLQLEKQGKTTTISKLVSEYGQSKGKVEKIVVSLIDKDLVKIKIVNKNKIIHIRTIFDRLLLTYGVPEVNSTQEAKLSWFSSSLKLDLNDQKINKKIMSWIASNGFSKMKTIVKELNRRLPSKKITFSLVNELYMDDEKKEDLNKKRLEEILEHNWLEK